MARLKDVIIVFAILFIVILLPIRFVSKEKGDVSENINPELIEDSNINKKKQILFKVIKKRDATATPFLIKFLNDPDYEIRILAIRALGIKGNKFAIKPLKKLLKNEDWRIRQNAVSSLGKIGEKEVIEPLLSALKDPNWKVSICAAETLGFMRNKKGINYLINLFNNSEDEKIRKEAENSLKRIVKSARAVSGEKFSISQEEIF